MRQRGIATSTFLTHAVVVGSLLALAVPASADPIADKALPAAQTAVATTPVTETVAIMPAVAAPSALPATTLPPTPLPADALPAAAVPPAAGRTGQPPETAQRGERRMVFSYILLRGLQGAGPFAGR
jgi:hypothetical protein